MCCATKLNSSLLMCRRAIYLRYNDSNLKQFLLQILSDCIIFQTYDMLLTLPPTMQTCSRLIPVWVGQISVDSQPFETLFTTTLQRLHFEKRLLPPHIMHGHQRIFDHLVTSSTSVSIKKTSYCVSKGLEHIRDQLSHFSFTIHPL